MNKRWFVLLMFTAVLTIACQEQIPPAAVKKAEELVEAHELFKQGKFAESVPVFAAYLQKNEAIGQEEARLGLAAASFLADLPTWKKHVETWQATSVYHWQGKSFTLSDGLSKNAAEYVTSHLGQGHPSRTFFLLLHFLLSQHQYVTLPRLIAAMPEKELAWEMSLSFAWAQVKGGHYSDAADLFAIMLAPSPLARSDITPAPQVTPAQCQEAWWGLCLSKVAQQPDASDVAAVTKEQKFLPTGWEYQIERQVFDFFRPGTPIARHRDAGQQIFDKCDKRLVVQFLLCDMMFVVGSQARNRLDLWHKGMTLLRQLTSPQELAELQSIRNDLGQRLELAIAWDNWISGRNEQARATFKKFAANPGIWQHEGLLGIALLAWKEDASLQDLADKFPVTSWPAYALGGREFSFYRLESRKPRTAAIDALLAKEPEHKTYLILFDALCLLGDGRAAYQLLGHIVAEYSDPAVKQIYLEEQGNIPKDVYAQNQIWEKMD